MQCIDIGTIELICFDWMSIKQETLNTLRFCCTAEKSIRQVLEYWHLFKDDSL